MPDKEKKLTANEASIKTATIEVKILQIGNRQFTLSVFDQLTEEPLIDPETGKLQGIAWGRVNRHTDCKELTKLEVEHLHIIWQKDNELRRSITAIPWQVAHYRTHPNDIPKAIACSYFQKIEERNELAALWIKARILAGERFNFSQTNLLVPFNIADHLFEVRLDYSTVIATTSHAPHYLQQFRKDLQNSVETTKVAVVEQHLVQAAIAVGKLVTAWEKSYQQLTKLDQLFIAV